MIRQQINLYIRQEKVRVPFSAPVCLIIALVTLVLVSGLYWREQVALTAVEAAVAQAKEDKKQRDAEINTLATQLQGRQSDPKLLAERQRLEAELRARQQFGSLLAQLEDNQLLRFSQLLAGLSNQAVEGLWLTRITTRDGGRQLELNGQTRDSALIPRYLRRLGAEPGYQAAQFDGVQISQQPKGLRFAVKGVLGGGRS